MTVIYLVWIIGGSRFCSNKLGTTMRRTSFRRKMKTVLVHVEFEFLQNKPH